MYPVHNLPVGIGQLLLLQILGLFLPVSVQAAGPKETPEIPMPCTCCGYDYSPTKRAGAIWQGNQVRVHWSDSRVYSSVGVFRRPGPCSAGGSWSQIATVTNGTEFLDSTVSPGTAYAYAVDSLTFCGATLSECVDATQPDACVSFSGLQTITADTTGCATGLSWNSASALCGGTLSYDIYRSLSSGFTPGPASLVASGVASTSWTDPGRWGYANYYYVVRARDSLGHQEANQSRGYALYPIHTFGGWAATTADFSACGVHASWNPPASGCGPVSYNLYRSNDTAYGSPQLLVASLPSGTTQYFDKTGVRSNQYSSYVVMYVDAFGVEHLNYNNRECNLFTNCNATKGNPLAPLGFAGLQSVSSGTLSACADTLSWQTAQNACGVQPYYNIYRSTDSAFTPGPAFLLNSGVSGTTYADVDGLVSGIPYYYIVRAIDTQMAEDTNTVMRSAIPTSPVSPITMTENFEGSQSGGGFDLPGWTHYAIQGNADWQWSAITNQSPTHAWFSPSQSVIATRALVSPVFPLNSGATLSFWHTYEFDDPSNCFDGGTLEITTNDGASWSVVPDSAFTAGGFTGTIFGVYGNPLGGKRGWCSGTLGAMTQVNVNLNAWAGQSIRLRWRAGEDYTNARPGWYIDSVSVTQVGAPGACTTCGRLPNISTLTAWKSGSDWSAGWSGAAGASAYRVYRSIDSHPLSWGDAAGSVSFATPAWNDTGAIAVGSSTYYTVTAVTSCGSESGK